MYLDIEQKILRPVGFDIDAALRRGTVCVRKMVTQVVDVVHASNNARALAAIVIKDGILNRDVCAIAQVKAIAARIIARNSADGHVAGIRNAQTMPLLTARV